MNDSAALYLSPPGLINALGDDRQSVLAAMLDGHSRLTVTEAFSPGRPLPVGQVNTPLPAGPTRNNRLLLAAAAQLDDELAQARARYGSGRIGVILGTSTSGVAESEQAWAAHRADGAFPPGFRYQAQEMGDPARFLAATLDLGGPAYTLSTACSSSAKVFAAARRLLAIDWCDAVLVGGADSLCQLTVQGFSALDSTSAQRSNPFSRHRDGINIGEGAALFLLDREPREIALLGVGESSDAYHISAPDPSGAGAERAMRGALADAAVAPEQVDYLNLHGTATAQNDAMESAAVSRVLGAATWCSSTKPLTGHTLGAAGATEVALCWLALAADYGAGRLPPHCWDGAADPDLPALRWVREGTQVPARVAMSNSFAFGGSNAAVLIGDRTALGSQP